MNSLEIMDPHTRLAILLGNLETYRKLHYLNKTLLMGEDENSSENEHIKQVGSTEKEVLDSLQIDIKEVVMEKEIGNQYLMGSVSRLNSNYILPYL